MDYTDLGRTGLRVSRLCFGTMSFGKEADEAESARLFGRCRDAGINFFDCANVYAGGRSEEILGKLAASARDRLVLTSKVGMHAGIAAVHGGLSAATLTAECEASLRRLGTDYLDVYFCHCEDRATPLEETLTALDALVRAGKVRAIGVSNWFAWRLARALGVSERLGLASVGVLQPMYSLAKRTAEVELLPLAQAEGLGVISYSPLGGGLLTGKYGGGTHPDGRLAVNPMYARRYAETTYHDIAARLGEEAAREGVSAVTLAVAWVLANPAVTAPILGARNVAQLEPALAAADRRLSDDRYRELCALTPPPPVATDRDEERS